VDLLSDSLAAGPGLRDVTQQPLLLLQFPLVVASLVRNSMACFSAACTFGLPTFVWRKKRIC